VRRPPRHSSWATRRGRSEEKGPLLRASATRGMEAGDPTTPRDFDWSASRRFVLGQAVLLSAAEGPAAAAGGGASASAPEVVRRLWGNGLRSVEDAERWAKEAFAEDCVYEDLYYAEPAVGPSAVASLLRDKILPEGSELVVDRISDGRKSCGFTWHILQPSVGVGQRGLAFVRLNSDGRIQFVREVGEPLFKAGELTEKLLEALTKDQPAPVKPPKPAELETPRTAGDIVRYLYGPVQQSGGDAVRFYSEDVVYEDMNYEKPFVGKPAVEGFLARFQAIQGVTFKLEEVSDGTQAVGFTYTIEIKGQPRGIRGATFYEVDRDGKFCYVRDVPESATKPPPVQFAARLVRPGLRRLQPSDPLPGDVAGKDPLLAI